MIAVARLGRRNPAMLFAIGALALLAIGPLWLRPLQLNLLNICMYYVVLAASWNLLAGYAGQFSLAQQTFAGLGGYASGLLIFHLDVPIWVGFIGAVVVSGGTGFLLGVLVLRMRGIYLAVATWAFAESVRLVVSAAFTFTRGDQGLHVPSLLGSLEPFRYYYIFMAVMVVLVGAMYLVIRSPIGWYLRAIKDDELAAQAMGVNTVKWKVFVMTFASTIAGIAGFFFAHYIVILSPSILSFNEIGKVIIMVVFGGLGLFAGPLVGAPLVVIITELTRDYGAWSMVAYSFIVIVMMRFYRHGAVALALHGWRLLKQATRRDRAAPESGPRE